MHQDNCIKKRYFTAVDGLRLVTSLNIVLFHLQGIGGLWDMREQPAWLFRILKGPAFHASVFFVLGGFIFTIKFAHKAAEFDNLAFLRKRFQELYPLHVITTLMMAALTLVHHPPADGVAFSKLFFSIFMHLSLLWSLCPFGSYTLNQPSWALGTFFFCYLLFGTALRIVVKIERRRTCMLVAAGCLLPLLLWGLLYGALGTPEPLYFFFHIFAPVRFFEFLLGMVLARFFMISERSKRSTPIDGIINDFAIAAVVILIYLNLSLKTSYSKLLIYFSYHFFMIPLYLLMLYFLTLERGLVCRLLSLPLIRKTGRSSFYPYLVHIPLISAIACICEQIFGYYRFLHRPVNIVIFIILLYSLSYIYVNHIRSRKPSGPQCIKRSE